MYSYEERMRAVELYIKLGKRARATICQLPSNGSTGSTTAACSNPSGTSHPQKPKKTSTQRWKLKPWPRN